jgi:uncharacterized protein (DUF427 family)
LYLVIFKNNSIYKNRENEQFMNKEKIDKTMESVWDYPRPPRIEKTEHKIKVIHGGVVIASTERAYRILETSHPPTYYIPREDIRMEFFSPGSNRTYCEWKGWANYFDLVMGGTVIREAAWTYPEPNRKYYELADYLSFYAQKMDACFVDDEKVDSQAGSFYGGWVNSWIKGPFKGGPGTMGW